MLDSVQLYRRRLFEAAGLETVGRTDENRPNHENVGGPYTFMDADDGNEPRDDLHLFTPADKENFGGQIDGSYISTSKRR